MAEGKLVAGFLVLLALAGATIEDRPPPPPVASLPPLPARPPIDQTPALVDVTRAPIPALKDPSLLDPDRKPAGGGRRLPGRVR